MTTRPPAPAIPPVRPSAALEADYAKRLEALVGEMHSSLLWWIRAAWRVRPPSTLAQDASPASMLAAAMRRLARRWQRKFDKAGPKLGRYFAQRSSGRVDTQMMQYLRDVGFTVQFKMTPAMHDVMAATIAQQVSLISSIAEKHLTDVEGAVMRSVATGRDIGTLVKELEDTYGVTKRRAQFIARSQNNIATATLNKTRQAEIGIKKARWLHSAGGKHPRPEHVAFSGKLYDVAKGAYLEGKWTWPGVEPNCRCVSMSVVPALADFDWGHGSGVTKITRRKIGPDGKIQSGLETVYVRGE